MTHTPGPWRVDSTVGHGDYQIRNRKRRITAVRWDDSDHSLDDARLIAAAPELLEALEEVVASSGHVINAYVAEHARAAIAKAKGE